ncbi:hypothetical protein JMN10_13040 [Capnocytophaga genosp. AHN8471]|uniref:Uncharacterized protein n=1 Tax=Capnocytophaga genosp. AHN8471 TaxID=327574 RepID=A0ABS1YZY8_9FLAO|nr:hypothetical protein [Capnocytophaga genosp. AHN8471]MBM0651986.1 hypothetical protein [Capnocytophaga genosp. AHN8471]MBM0663093.1 hypothetical protein [Capnocytophaga genosp. AHN8471]
MKHFLITLLLCAPSIYAQNPLKGEWITSSLLRDFKKGYQNLLVLTQREDERGGYATEFKKNDKNQYISYYFAPCGNDCFPSVSGTFQLIAPSYVRLNALTFEQTGDCKHKNEKLHNDTADYYIYKVSDKKIFLVRSISKNEKEDQEKAKNYLLVTGIKDDVVYKQKTKMKVEAKEIGALPAQVEKYATDILQLKKFKILIYNQLRGRAAWVFAVKDLTTGMITYVIQENYYDAKDKEISRFFDCTETEIKKFRQ